MRTPGVLRETDLELLRTLRIISAESPGKCKGKYKGDKEEMVILYIVILYNLYQQGGIWTNVGFF